MPIAPFRMGYLLVGRVRSGVGIGVGVFICSSESESDSESLKLRRLRCHASYYKIFFYFSDQGGGHGLLASPAPWLRPCGLSGCAAHTTYHGRARSFAYRQTSHAAYRTPSQRSLVGFQLALYDC